MISKFKLILMWLILLMGGVTTLTYANNQDRPTVEEEAYIDDPNNGINDNAPSSDYEQEDLAEDSLPDS